MIKVLPKELSETMNDCIYIVNFVTVRVLNLRIFLLLCEKMGSEHQSLLFHKSGCWVSRGKVLARHFELRHEINEFLLCQDNDHLHKHLEDHRWIVKLE